MFSEKDLQELCDALGIDRVDRATDLDVCTMLLCKSHGIDPAQLDVAQRVGVLCNEVGESYNRETTSPDEGLKVYVDAAKNIAANGGRELDPVVPNPFGL